MPLSLAAATGAGPQVSAQGVPGGEILHDPLQHLSDPAGHVDSGLRRAPVPQQLYVGTAETHNFVVFGALDCVASHRTERVFGSLCGN